MVQKEYDEKIEKLSLKHENDMKLVINDMITNKTHVLVFFSSAKKIEIDKPYNVDKLVVSSLCGH